MFLSVDQGHTIERAATGTDLVTMGINPTKPELHQGHFLTMFQAMKAVLRGNRTRGLFFIDDREFHFPNGIKQNERDTFRLPGEDNVNSIRQHMSRFIEQLSLEMGESNLPNRINIVRMSDYLSLSQEGTPHAQLMYDLLRKNHAQISMLFEFERNPEGNRHTIRPTCPSCEHGPCVESRIIYEQKRIVSHCRRHLCEESGYSVNIDQGDSNWSMHYTIDPLRDILLANELDAKVLHVFGGDYGVPWGWSSWPKAKRLSSLIPRLDKTAHVDHFVGPLLKKNGAKLSKSNDDRSTPLTLEEMEQIIGSKKAVLEMAKPTEVDAPKRAAAPEAVAAQ